MKRFQTALALFICLVLTGCGQLIPGRTTIATATLDPTVLETAQDSAREPAPAAEVPVTEPSADSGSAQTLAFRNALDMAWYSRMWPCFGTEIALFEPEDIALQRFAILDVDTDGKDELILSVTNTYIAGMMEVIYGYDEERDSLFEEASFFPAATYYGTMIAAGRSHNQGLAGEALWPYTLLQYNPASDLYVLGGDVDAWDSSLWETDYEGNPFPKELDTDGTGVLYLLTGENTEIMSKSQYESWKNAVFGGEKELEIPWQELNRANIEKATPVDESGGCVITEQQGFSWQGEKIDVFFEADGEEIRIYKAVHSPILLASCRFPQTLPMPRSASIDITDYNDDGTGDVSARLQYADGSEANILFLSDGETYYYNEEFSILPGQPGPRGYE